MNADFIKEKLIFCLINTERNKEMIQNRPHRQFHDLSIIYQIVVEIDDKRLKSISLDNSLVNNFGLSEEELFSLAKENTRKMFPPTVTDIEDILCSGSSNVPMIVISNEDGMYGAVNVLYEDTLDIASKKVGGNLYLLPSSVHEFIAVPDTGDLEGIKNIVSEMNELLLEKEKLSDNIYYYDRESKTITQL